MTKAERDSLTDPDGRSLSYQARAPSLAKRFARVVSRSLKDVNNLMERLLSTFQYKGGFRTRAEAQNWLSLNINRDALEMLTDFAGRIQDIDIRDKLLARIGAQATAFRLSRLDAINMSIKANQYILMEAVIRDVSPVLIDVVDEAFSRQTFTIQKQVGVGWRMDALPGNQIRIIMNSQLEGSARWFSRIINNQLRDTVTEGLMTGKPLRDISKDIDKMKTPTRSSMMVARTVLTEVSNEAEHKALEQTSVKRYEYVATLDERTCPVCGRLDGKTFPLDKAKKGINFPPMHPNCRCVHIAALTDEVRQELTRFARDSEGKRISVPATMTYEEWRAKFYQKAK